MNDEIDYYTRAKDREHAAKNRTHADDILHGTWPTTGEQRTTADSVLNLVSTSIPFQRMVSEHACKYDGLARSSPQILTFQHFDLVYTCEL